MEQTSFSEFVVDLLHLHDDIVGDTSLGKEDVELSGHSTSHRVDSESHLDTSITGNKRKIESLAGVGREERER